jgi:hypothetical protein
MMRFTNCWWAPACSRRECRAGVECRLLAGVRVDGHVVASPRGALGRPLKGAAVAAASTAAAAAAARLPGRNRARTSARGSSPERANAPHARRHTQGHAGVFEKPSHQPGGLPAVHSWPCPPDLRRAACMQTPCTFARGSSGRAAKLRLGQAGATRLELRGTAFARRGRLKVTCTGCGGARARAVDRRQRDPRAAARPRRRPGREAAWRYCSTPTTTHPHPRAAAARPSAQQPGGQMGRPRTRVQHPCMGLLRQKITQKWRSRCRPRRPWSGPAVGVGGRRSRALGTRAPVAGGSSTLLRHVWGWPIGERRRGPTAAAPLAPRSRAPRRGAAAHDRARQVRICFTGPSVTPALGRGAPSCPSPISSWQFAPCPPTRPSFARFRLGLNWAAAHWRSGAAAADDRMCCLRAGGQRKPQREGYRTCSSVLPPARGSKSGKGRSRTPSRTAAHTASALVPPPLRPAAPRSRSSAPSRLSPRVWSAAWAP